MIDVLWRLVLVMSPLSLLAIGGTTSVLSDLHHQAVAVQGWLTDAEFDALYAIAQVLPGPGSLFSALIGLKAAGIPGALVAVAAMYLPACVLMYLGAGAWARLKRGRIGLAVERGLGPLAIGLIMAGALAIARTANHDPAAYAICAAATALFLWRNVNPLPVLLIGGLIGALAG